MNENVQEEINRIEYQSVILAALLHDIGKFLHRGAGAKPSGTISNFFGVKQRLLAVALAGKPFFDCRCAHRLVQLVRELAFQRQQRIIQRLGFFFR